MGVTVIRKNVTHNVDIVTDANQGSYLIGVNGKYIITVKKDGYNTITKEKEIDCTEGNVCNPCNDTITVYLESICADKDASLMITVTDKEVGNAKINDARVEVQMIKATGDAEKVETGFTKDGTLEVEIKY